MIRILSLAAALALLSACSSGTSSSNPDVKVIEQLRLAGSDLSKPHPIEFFFYFSSETAATSACDALRAEDFSISVQPSAATSEYVCLATKSVVPTTKRMSRLRSEFESLASSLGGEYDGWGTVIVE